MVRTAQNSPKLVNRSLSFTGEIVVDKGIPATDLLPVNQRVAGSSPADGANIYAAYKDVGRRE